VFVLNKNGIPLMLTKSGKARRLLKLGHAKVIITRPFVIKMLVQTSEYKQPLSLFNIHKITNPDVNNYQLGRQMGFYNTKAFVLSRDSYCCQICNSNWKSKNKSDNLHVHHILFRSNAGNNSPDNLITLCKICHDDLHSRKGAQEFSLTLTEKRKANTTDATHISTIANQLRKSVNFKFVETFGYITKFNREHLKLGKEHYNDAIAIACQSEIIDLDFSQLKLHKKRNIQKGDYQQTWGKRSEKRYPAGKLFGLRKFDLVKTEKGIGFVKGKRPTGFFALSTIDGEKVADSVNIKKNSRRITARGSFIMEAQFLPVSKDRVSLRRTG
jgi:hypothetical protein